MNPGNFLLLLLTLTFISCSNSSDKKLASEQTTSNETTVVSPKTEEYRSPNVPADVDSKFETFIEYFSKDSLFQISRIDFPLKVKASDGNGETETIINKSDFRKLTFGDKSAKTREFDKYEQTYKIEGNKAVVETRGIDNGIFIDTYFEKINGKWELVTSVDSSD